MYDSTKEGLQIYREEMAKYRRYFDAHGFRVGQSAATLSKPVERDLVLFSGRLEGMRDALGMNKEEKLEIDREFGFEINPASSPESETPLYTSRV